MPRVTDSFPGLGNAITRLMIDHLANKRNIDLTDKEQIALALAGWFAPSDIVAFIDADPKISFELKSLDWHYEHEPAEGWVPETVVTEHATRDAAIIAMQDAKDRRAKLIADGLAYTTRRVEYEINPKIVLNAGAA